VVFRGCLICNSRRYEILSAEVIQKMYCEVLCRLEAEPVGHL